MQGFWTGGDKSQINATGLEHQSGTKVLFCFLCSLMIQQGPLRLLFSFLGPKDSFMFQEAQADVARKLASEVLQCRFHCILLVKQIILGQCRFLGKDIRPFLSK